jgi:hypothetical protein
VNAVTAVQVITAELPDPSDEKELWDIVVKTMIHGPCGAANPQCPCMLKPGKEGSCKDKYPRQFREQTELSDSACPMYRRRNNGRKHHIKKGKVTHEVTNQHVVPYNKALLLKYKCHINVEICSGIRAIKYLHKYFYKGPDRVQAVLTNEGQNATGHRDEIKEYLDCR